MWLATAPEVVSEVEELYFRAALARGARQLTILPDRPDGPPVQISYDQLLLAARATACGLLQSQAIQPGVPFLLVASTGLPVIQAFLGGLLAGALPVPVSPPTGLTGVEAWRDRLESMAQSFQASAIVAEEAYLSLLRGEISCPLLEAAGLPTPGEPPQGRPAGDAYVQPTSGSTGGSKGVLVSHSNLTANLFMIGWGSNVVAEDRVVSWLPLYHDMGLVGAVLFSLYWNLDLTLFSPMAFLSRPARWLQAIHQSRGTLSPAPSFAYSYVAHRLRDADLSGLDLSSWRVAYCGAEPIQRQAVERFAARLAPAGFSAGTILPCYGLAEATLAVCFAPPGRGLSSREVSRRALAQGEVRAPQGPEDLLELVLNGRPLPELSLEIRDPELRPVPPGRTGTIWIRGSSVTRGYLGDSAAGTSSSHHEGWLNTGDLGCWLEGELAVVGRVKDLLIVRGRNYSPIDLEWAAEAVPGVRAGSVAAFSCQDLEQGTELPRLVCEVARGESDWSKGAIARGVYEAVLRHTGLRLEDVRLLPPGSIPRTTSGKIRRGQTKLLYEAGELEG